MLGGTVNVIRFAVLSCCFCRIFLYSLHMGRLVFALLPIFAARLGKAESNQLLLTIKCVYPLDVCKENMSYYECWFGLSFLAGGIAGIVLGVSFGVTVIALIILIVTILRHKVHYLYEQYSACIVIR